jgi:hypothetical protein
MIGEHYWSIGIVIWLFDARPGQAQRWGALLDFYDDAWAPENGTEGRLKARYLGPLNEVLPMLKADAERLGIIWRDPHILYRDDGQPQPDADPPPANWRTICNEEGRKLGWKPLYQEE